MIRNMLFRTVTPIFLASFSLNAHADYLCTDHCEFTITFPDGGSIGTGGQLILEFGDNGLIDTGVVTTTMSLGDSIELGEFDTLDFMPGGEFVLGDGGNIDASDLVIVSDGGTILKAVGGDEIIELPNLDILGDITISGNTIRIDGSITAGGIVNINGTALFEPDPPVCDLSTTGSASGTFTFSGFGAARRPSVDTDAAIPMIVWDGDEDNLWTTSIGNWDPVCPDDPSTIDIIGSPPFIVGGNNIIDPGVFDFNVTPAIEIGTLNLIEIEPGVLDLTFQLTSENLYLFEGSEFSTTDGNSCMVADGECFTSAGAKYVVNADGELVPAEEGSSRLHPVFLAMMAAWYLLRRRLRH